VKRLDLERHLRAHGARVLDEGANHTRWARGPNRSAVPRHREIGTGLAGAICRQLGMPPPPDRAESVRLAGPPRAIASRSCRSSLTT
jgi:HicA toxin of bacterial toxin-antitoxin,